MRANKVAVGSCGQKVFFIRGWADMMVTGGHSQTQGGGVRSQHRESFSW